MYRDRNSWAGMKSPANRGMGAIVLVYLQAEPVQYGS